MALEVTRAAPVSKPPPADPAAELPRSVRRQVARSEELQQQLQPPSGDPDAPTPATANSTDPPTPVQPTMAGAQPGSAAAPQEPPTPNSVAPPAPQAGPSPSHTPTPAPSGDEDWEQRFRSLEGRYRADMERSAQRMMQLEREAATRPAPPAPVQPQSLLTPEEIQEYGPEFVDLVRRAATEAQTPLLAEISNLKGQLDAASRRSLVSANDQMHRDMDARLPGWQDINNHPDFVAWSRLPDIYSGAIRQSLMQDAWNRGDAQRVEAFFRGFLAEQGVQVPQGQQPTPAAPRQPQPNGSAGPAQQPRVTLESLAAPGRARSAPPTPADKPVYTQAQILQFYTDVATGRFRGTPEEQAAIDRDIIAAQHEGRIIVDTRAAARPPAGFTR